MKGKINQQNPAKDCDDNEIIITDCDGNISISSDETDSYLNRFRNYSAMSITGVHPMGIHTRHMSLLSLNENWDNDNYLPLAQNTEDMHLEWCCCFTCGVSWPDQHVTLDCKECGGYSMDRPCVLCDGQCGAIWKRDLHLSHSTSKARWHGECETKTSISPITQDFDQNSNIQRGHCPPPNC